MPYVEIDFLTFHRVVRVNVKDYLEHQALYLPAFKWNHKRFSRCHKMIGRYWDNNLLMKPWDIQPNLRHWDKHTPRQKMLDVQYKRFPKLYKGIGWIDGNKRKLL